MLVYRMEGPDGNGPYRPADETQWVTAADLVEDELGPYVLTGDDRQPIPTMDGVPTPPLDDMQNWYFGFANRAHLDRWFPYRARKLLEQAHGFRVVKYDVPEQFVLRGRSQVAFRKASAVKIGG